MRTGLPVSIAVVTAFTGLLATTAMAEHNDAETFFEELRSSVITGYEPCLPGNVNDATNGTVVGLPACHPADPDLRSDPQCGFDLGPAGENKAGGKILFKAPKFDLDNNAATASLTIAAKVNGILGCQGETLCPFLNTRATTDACVSGDVGGCTIPDGTLFTGPGLCCVVDKGKCKINVKGLTSYLWFPNAVSTDDDTGFAVYGCGLTRVTNVINPLDPPPSTLNRVSFPCGFKFP
jgi:hypothetical protein